VSPSVTTGLTDLLAALMAAGAVVVALAAPAPSRPSRRWPASKSSALRPHSDPADHRSGWLAHPLAWPAGSVMLGAAVWSWVGGLSGLIVGIALAVVGVVIGRRAARVPRVARPSSPEQAALAADLLTAALDAGLPIGTALAATGSALGGSLGEALEDAAALQAVGADPTGATRALRAHPGGARLARALARAQDSGMAPGAVLAAAAEAERDRARSEQLSRAASAGAFAALPVGLLFLPAFVLVTVVPLVLGSLSGVLG